MHTRSRRWAKLILAVLTLFLLVKVGDPGAAYYPDKDGLIRFHVVAHSDHPRDQAAKLLVRDAVVAETSSLFSQAASSSEAERLLLQNLSGIENTARAVLAEHGCAYGARADTGVFPFPERSYEDLTLPAGRYRALKLVLGEGQGSNWWCILFPPLCFVAGSSGTASIPVDKESLSAEDAEPVMAGVQDADPAQSPKVQVRFKLVELWRKYKPQRLSLFAASQERH